MGNPECWSEVEEGGKFRYFYWGKGWSKIVGLCEGGGGGCYHGKLSFYAFQRAIVERFLAGYHLQNT